MNESFVFYRSFYEGLAYLPAEDQLATYKAIMDYAFYGTIPEAGGVVMAMFMLAKAQIDANEKRRNDGNKGGRPSKKPVVTETETSGYEVSEIEKPVVIESETSGYEKTENPKPNVNVNANANVNANENVNGNVNVNGEVQKGKRQRFTPPTRSQVKDYCLERNNRVDPDRFYDYYESNGWRVGKNAMKDWKAAVRTWETNNKDSPPQRSGTTNKFNQYANKQAYDFAAIEAAYSSDLGDYANEQEEFKKFLASG